MNEDALKTTIDKKAREYERRGVFQEWTHWIGSGLSAVFSAIAAISVGTGNVSNVWGGEFVVALFAIVPAVWAAIDRAIQVRRLSIYNYRMSTNLTKILLEFGDSDSDPNKVAIRQKYLEFLEFEQAKFEEMFGGKTD
jgi:hypothetical protein